MITSLKISNVKSYSGNHEIPFRMINLIAGANSSGKSTLIQSLLLLKQTIQYGAADRSLLLNGPLLRLGSFDEVVTSTGKPESFVIGFQMTFTEAAMRTIRQQWMSSSHTYFLGSKQDSYISEIILQANWTKSAERTVSAPQSRFAPDLTKLSMDIVKVEPAEVQRQSLSLISAKNLDQKPMLPFQAILDPISMVEIGREKPKYKLIGGSVDRFLPQYVGTSFDASAKRADEISKFIFERSFFGTQASASLGKEIIPAEAVRLVSEWLKRHGIDDLAVTDLSAELIRAATDKIIPPYDLLRPRNISPEIETEAGEMKEVFSKVLADLSPEKTDFDFSLPGNVRLATQIVQEVFRDGLRYLGPLRDPPRPVYQLEALPSSTDVGYRGEHTAAVLDLNKDKYIHYFAPPSENLDSDYISEATMKYDSLQVAVVTWLQYLGVAESVRTNDEGVFGNRLRVSTNGSGNLHDLTNVGVGVSQVLPIVVMALLASDESFLIFEQPELHLHPKVQARLADFFLSLALHNKQVVAETHSEYMIDRMRLRVALADDDRLRSMLNIMFSERRLGQSNLRSIQLTEYGSVVDWPADFFDQSQSDVAKILKAASAKRAARRQTT